MWTKSIVILAMSLEMFACTHQTSQVSERIPDVKSGTVPNDASRYIRELANATVPDSFDASLVSPDRTKTLEVTNDLDYMGLPTGFYGFLLKDATTGNARPLLSLWEADVGSGLSASISWSADSRAIRLNGSTRGFRRSGGELEKFDLVYVIELDRFFNTSSSRQATAPSNTCLKLTVCGTLAVRQNAPALARRSLTMRWRTR
jgi:hypothetical protein